MSQPVTILYVAERLRGEFGAAYSGVDVLKALAASPHPIEVMSRTPVVFANDEFYISGVQLPTEAAGYPLKPVRSFDPTQPASEPTQPKPGGGLRGLLGRAFARRAGPPAEPGLAIVNSLASHNFFMEHGRPERFKRRVLIVRESPRHFGEEGQRRTVAGAVEAMRGYTDFIFVSARCRAEWMAMPELAGRGSHHIPNCCEEESAGKLLTVTRADVRKDIGSAQIRSATGPIALCLASLQRRKGQDLLLDAWPEIAEACPDLTLHFMGPVIEWGGGPELRARIEAAPRRNRIIRQDGGDGLDNIRAADLLILPARAEAMPRVVLEAMALKTPVIASDVDGIPELIEHGKSGLIFPIGEPERLAGLVIRAMNDPALRERLAEAAHGRYWANFSRAHQIERYGKLLAELTETA